MNAYLLRMKLLALALLVFLPLGCGALTGLRGSGAVSFEEIPLPEPSAARARLASSIYSIEPHTVKYPPLIVRDHAGVRHFIRYFRTTRRRFMGESLIRREKYKLMMRGVFSYYGLPEDLSYIALVESGYKPVARSHRSAVGMWQFMRRTARHCGLEVSAWTDERRNPEKSTLAAARYLKELYDRFGDWYLAIAAYNGGPGRVSRAIRRTGSRDFFVIAKSGYLRRETIDFVPKVLAAIVIGRNPEQFGFAVGVTEEDA